jgi:glycosyltransferase involved in cell wall biosynthesis
MSKLTIGIPTYDDYDGLYFTIQSIRMYHQEVLNDIEFVVIDNNPNGVCGETNKKFCGSITQPYQYIPFDSYSGTAAAKNKIFEHARTPYVMSIDCHVLLQPKSLKKLINYFETGKDDGNLLQGPLIYDDMQNISTHFDLVWRGDMWGIWETDKRGLDINAEPFEIPAQGMGLFACRKDAWVGFNPLLRGFGGEEGYIHEKFRMKGKKAMCLPFLRWLHRFDRPNGIPYNLTYEDKIRNYFITFKELGRDLSEITETFQEHVGLEVIQNVYTNTMKEIKDGIH